MTPNDHQEQMPAPPPAAADGAQALEFLERITDQFYALDREWRFTYVNARGEEFLGRRREELIGQSLWELFPQTVGQTMYDQYRRAVAEQTPRVFEAESSIARGRWLEIHAYPSPSGLSIYCRDVTERKRAEQALRSAKQELNALVGSAPLAVVMLDRADRVVVWNRAAERLFGWKAEEVLGEPYPIVPADRAEEHRRLVEQCFSSGWAVQGYETRRQRKDGSQVGVAIWTSRVGTGPDARTVVMLADTTEAQAAEERLRQSEQQFRALTENGADIITVLDPDGTRRYASPSYQRVLGYGPDELVGTDIFKLIHPEDEARTRATFERLVATPGARDRLELRIRRADQSWATLEVTATNMRDVPAVGGVVVNGRDVTEQRRAEERLRRVTATSPVILYTLAVENDRRRPTWVSANIEELFGYTVEEALADDWWLTNVHPDDRDAAAGAMAGLPSKDSCSHGYRFRRKDGEYRWVRDQWRVRRDPSSGTIEIVGSWMDSTDFRRLETQLHQAQKMEAIGRLAGGIAHDFNNVLTAINGYGELVLEELPASDPLRPDVEEITRAGGRGADLVRQLLAFSRREAVRPEIVAPDSIIAGLEKMLRRLIGADVELETRLESSPGHVRVDRAQFEQAILNLAINARDAMPDGGRLTISTRRAAEPRSPGGAQVEIAVADTGSGMSPDVQAKIFEPFFTTKEKGKGTGLGLSTVYGIVQQSGGAIRVESLPGAGATFRITLPEVEAAPPADPALAAPPGAARSERVLLVEDEANVRAFARRVLERHGYRVVEASDGVEALAVWEASREPVDVLVTDVVMPRMSGRALADELRARRPSLPVLLMSGYADSELAHDGGLPPATEFLPKPFAATDLARRLATLLDGQQAG